MGNNQNPVLMIVADTTDNELPVFIGTVKEIAKYLNCVPATIYAHAKQGTLCQDRWKIVRVLDD